eukprot:4226092-Amphidinium_carterae.1
MAIAAMAMMVRVEDEYGEDDDDDDDDEEEEDGHDKHDHNSLEERGFREKQRTAKNLKHSITAWICCMLAAARCVQGSLKAV